MTESSKAAFLSYASQDAEATKRICAALRAAGIEVWFDQSELRGGDAWDQTIRRQIKTCDLFIPVISATTHAREEGYFRLEWKLAVDRSHLMAGTKAFLLPVVIDDTRDDDERIPEKFREVQWTRLPGGTTTPAFVERVAKLLSPEISRGSIEDRSRPETVARNIAAGPRSAALPTFGARRIPLVIAAVAFIGIGYLALDEFVLSKRSVSRAEIAAPTAASFSALTTAISEKSVAVLPFTDMSEKKDQEYFSDGLSEELIDMLAKLHGLRVPARTSSFYFKGKNETIESIARQLQVANLLEGSVRKAGGRLRITAQLIRADNGDHLWSETYDRDAKDIFSVQDEIAAAVVKSLSLTLLKGSILQSAKAANSDAYTLYLQGRSIAENAPDRPSSEHGIALIEESAKLDPTYAPTWATLSRLRLGNFMDYDVGSFAAVRNSALRDAERALALDPNLAEGHVAKGRVLSSLDWNWNEAEREIHRALELDGANATVLRNAYYLSGYLGRWEEAVQRAQAAVDLDPLNFTNYERLADAELGAGQYAASEASYRKAIALQPKATYLHGSLAEVLWLKGAPTEALAENELETDPENHAENRAIYLYALGRRPEADRALAEVETKYGATSAFYVGVIYAARKDFTGAFTWWNRALERRDLGLLWTKLTPIAAMAPELATDSRFKALLRKLNMPE